MTKQKYEQIYTNFIQSRPNMAVDVAEEIYNTLFVDDYCIYVNLTESQLTCLLTGMMAMYAIGRQHGVDYVIEMERSLRKHG